MSKTYKLAIIGFGNVGQGLTKILAEKHLMLQNNFGIDIKIVAICDLYKGSIADPKGFDPQELLNAVSNTNSVSGIEAPHRGEESGRTRRPARAAPRGRAERADPPRRSRDRTSAGPSRSLCPWGREDSPRGATPPR